MHGIPGMMAHAAVPRHGMLWNEEFGMMTLGRFERVQKEELKNRVLGVFAMP